MERGQKILLNSRGWPAAFAALYAILAICALELARHLNDVALIWPSSGVAVAALLLFKPQLRKAFFAWMALASLSVNLLEGVAWPTALGFTAANLIECSVVAFFARDEGRWQFDKPKWVSRFVMAAALGGGISASIASFATSETWGVNFLLSWFSTVFLGVLLFTPMITETFRYFHSGKVRAADFSAADVGLAVLVATAATITFAQDKFPIMFIPFAAIIVVTFFRGLGGAIFATIIVCSVGSVLTVYGHGPIQFIEEGGFEKAIFFQLYLLLCFFCSIPMAAMLARSRHLQAEVSDRASLLSMAEKIGHIGHWYFKIGEDEVFWSDEVFRIHGLLPSARKVPLARAISFYHEEDRAKVEEALNRGITAGEPFEFSARIDRIDGEIRHIQSKGAVEYKDGKPQSMFGVVIDVTEQTHAMWDLKRAREQAEERSRVARLLAATDQLTGSATRRKLMAKMGSEIKRAEKKGTDLGFILFDVDHFKAINDTYGHVFGDRVLTAIVATAQNCLRATDLLGRLGGEEFGVVLPGADTDRAQKVAERIRAAIVSTEFDELALVSVSLGVASYQPGADIEWLIQSADMALYEAKRGGRNRTELAA